MFGFRKGAGAETAAFTLLESIAFYRERNSPVYCIFLDNEKAFDRIWLNGLFYKLYHFGINGKLWRILRSKYTSMQSCVKLGQFTSSPFPIKQGVGQDCVLSAWLFSLYINDLLYELEDLQKGLMLPWGNMPGMLLADDTTVASGAIDGLQSALNLCFNYSCRWHLKYNANKSVFLMFGNAQKITCPSLYIGDKLIPQNDHVIYAGLFISTALSTHERTQKSCEKLRMLANSNRCHGLCFGDLHPISAIGVWNRVILPCALFACELWCKLTSKEYEYLEKSQAYFCKYIQGLSKYISTMVARDCLALLSVQAYIEKRCLTFFW